MIMVFIYIVFFGLISILKYNHFCYNDQDLAIYAQLFHNILHGSAKSSILGYTFLGAHLNFILFFIAPIYFIFQTPISLLLLQTLTLGFSAYPIYLIAKEVLPKKFSLWVLFSYLFFPALGYMNLYEFHIPPLATLFISVLLYAIYKNRRSMFFTFMILAILCQENMPFVITPLGFYLLVIKKPLKWWLPTIVLGALWFWVSFYKLLPYFNRETIKFTMIYSHLGDSIGGILKNVFMHPLQTVHIIATKENRTFLFHLFAPALFLPFLSPISFLPALPSLFQHLLSQRELEHTIYAHYTAEIIPFIFFSSIFALKKLLSLKIFRGKENYFAACLFMVTITANWLIGPHIKCLFNPSEFGKSYLHEAKTALLRKIPDNAEVVATFEFLPKLSNRANLYSLQHAVKGSSTLSKISYKLPSSTEYALINFEDTLTFKSNFYRRQSSRNLRQTLSVGKFGIVDMIESLALFKKNTPSRYSLYKVLPSEPSPSNRLRAAVNEEIELIGFEVDEGEINTGIIFFKFYWHCIKKTDRVYGSFISLRNSQDRLIRECNRFICYRVYPTNDWQAGDFIEEHYKLQLPYNLPNTVYQIRMGIFDFETDSTQKMVATINGKVFYTTVINLSNKYYDNKN